jgi:hypothetical protein
MTDLNSYEESLANDLAKAEARIEELEKERDGYLAERNKFKLYLQRTHADLELEVAAVDALNAKLTKAVEWFKKLDRRGDALEAFDPVVHEIVIAALAELGGETK